METSEILFKRVLIPLILIMLTPIATALGSKLSTGNWKNWFLSTSKWLWIILISIFILWLFIALIYHRKKYLRELDKPSAGFFSVPLSGWRTMGKLPYKDVIWDIQVPTELSPSQTDPSDVEVKTPPRCQKCQTEIEEKRNFWGGFIWTCVRCGFKKRNKDSYYTESDRAEKIAKREFEIKREEFLKLKKE